MLAERNKRERTKDKAVRREMTAILTEGTLVEPDLIGICVIAYHLYTARAQSWARIYLLVSSPVDGKCCCVCLETEKKICTTVPQVQRMRITCCVFVRTPKSRTPLGSVLSILRLAHLMSVSSKMIVNGTSRPLWFMPSFITARIVMLASVWLDMDHHTCFPTHYFRGHFFELCFQPADSVIIRLISQDHSSHASRSNQTSRSGFL